MSDLKLVIFDWDGTLMDSERQIVHCMQVAAQELGLVVPNYRSVRRIIGLGLPEALQVLFPEHDVATHGLVRQGYARHFIAGAGGPSEFFVGAKDLLSQLRRRGLLLAVATGKNRPGLERVLEKTGMTNFFDASRCADETASKPDPLMLQELLAHLQVAPHKAIMVGDTTFDLEMAHRAGVPSIGMGHGVHAVEELALYSPLAIVDDIKALGICLATL